MAESDEVRPTALPNPQDRATGGQPPTGDTHREHDQDGGSPQDAAEDADEEQQRQLAEGQESPG